MPVSYDLGTAQGKIVIDYDGTGIRSAQTGINDLGRAAQNTTKTFDDFVPAIRTVGRTAAIAAGAIYAGFGLAVKSATDFEHQLSAVQAVSGATSDQMELVSDAALRIGKDTVFSATESALAMEELVKQGISVEDVLNGAADAAVSIAAAGGIGLPEAAGIAAAALNQFKLEASDLTDVANILAGAANASATGVEEVGMALSFVGPTANAAGVSFEDAALAIALFANNGIDSARAGTALRSMLVDLASPTDKAMAAMTELGIQTEGTGNVFFDAQGNMKPMAEVMDLLRTGFKGLTSEQKIAYGTAIVGQSQLSALNAILASTSEEVDALASSINNTSAADVAAERLNNFSGKLEELQGNVETAAIMIGNVLIPYLVDITNVVIAAIDQFTSLDEGTQKLIVGFLGVAAGVLLTIAVASKMIIVARDMQIAFSVINFGALVQGFNDFRAGLVSSAAAASTYTGVMGTLGGVVSAAAVAVQKFTLALIKNPLTLVLVAVAALVASMILLYQNSERFRAIFEPVISAAKKAAEQFAPALEQIGSLFSELIDTLVSSLVPVLVSLAEAFVPIIELLINLLAPILELVADILIAVLGPVLKIVGKLIEALAPIILILLKALEPLIEILLMVLVPVLDALAWVLGVVADALQVAADWVEKFFETSNDGTSQAGDAWAGFVGMLQDAWAAIVAFLQPAIDLIVGYFTYLFDTASAVWNNIMTVVGAVVDWFMTYVAPLIEAVVNLVTKWFHFLFSVIAWVWDQIFTAISNYVTMVVDTITTVWGAIIGFVTPIFNAIRDFIATVWGAIYGFISGIVNGVVDFIRGVWGNLMNIVRPYFEAVYQAIKGPIEQVYGFFQGVYDFITGFFANAGQWLIDAGANIIGGLIHGIEGALGWLTDTLNNITSLIPEEKGPPSKDATLLENSGSLIMQGLIAGLRGEIPELQAMLGGLTMGIPSAMQANINGALGASSGDSRVFNYNAAPGGPQLSAEEDLFVAMKRSKVVVPGWA